MALEVMSRLEASKRQREARSTQALAAVWHLRSARVSRHAATRLRAGGLAGHALEEVLVVFEGEDVPVAPVHFL